MSNKNNLTDRPSMDELVESGELVRNTDGTYGLPENNISYFPEDLKYRIEKEKEEEKGKIQKIIEK